MRNLLLIFLCTLFSVPSLFAQEENDPFDYGVEYLFGVTTSTNSGLVSGVNFRYGAKINDNLLRTFGIEIANVRHPQERKVRAFAYGGSLYEGKENYLISVRLLYGYDKILFRKADRKGVQINGVLVGGPSIGLVSPYYLRAENGDLVTYSEIRNGNQLPISAANYFAGVNEMEAAIGANLRASLLFEFGTFKSSITGFEIGGMLEYYNKEIPLVPLGTRNYQFYPSLYLGLIFGTRK